VLQSVNSTLYTARKRLHVSAHNDQPSSAPVARIQKRVHFTTAFQV